MYSVVLMAAMATPGDAQGFGNKGGCYGCNGCYSYSCGYSCSGCYGSSCHGCKGGGFLGLRHKSCSGCSGDCYGSSCHGCNGCCGGSGFLGLRHKSCHGCSGCHGCTGCYGSSCYGCTGCYGGCYGGVIVAPPAQPAMPKPEDKPKGGTTTGGTGAFLPPATMPPLGGTYIVPVQPAKVD